MRKNIKIFGIKTVLFLTILAFVAFGLFSIPWTQAVSPDCAGRPDGTICTPDTGGLGYCTGETCYGETNTNTSDTSANCSGNFEEIGGVCVPTGTGLAETDIKTIIINVMNWILGIFGFLAIIAFVISGIQYVTAAGNEDQMKSAKRNMIYSIIGVIIALSGYIIILTINMLLSGTGFY